MLRNLVLVFVGVNCWRQIFKGIVECSMDFLSGKNC